MDGFIRANKGHVEIATYFCSGADINKVDRKRGWRFHARAGKGQLDRDLTFERGADVNKADKDGDIALMRAARNGHADRPTSGAWSGCEQGESKRPDGSHIRSNGRPAQVVRVLIEHDADI